MKSERSAHETSPRTTFVSDKGLILPARAQRGGWVGEGGVRASTATQMRNVFGYLSMTLHNRRVENTLCRDGGARNEHPRARARPSLADPSATHAVRSGVDESFVTKSESARGDFVHGPLRREVSGGHLQAGGVSPRSLLSAAPHRGEANRPLRNQGKANAIRTTPKAPQAKKLTAAPSDNYPA
jgi:hypothetical protein